MGVVSARGDTIGVCPETGCGCLQKTGWTGAVSRSTKILLMLSAPVFLYFFIFCIYTVYWNSSRRTLKTLKLILHSLSELFVSFQCRCSFGNFAWLRVWLQSWWAGLLCKQRGSTQPDWCLPLLRAELHNKARPMERARQMLCSELRGELQLIYILCHAGEDKMFLYIKSRPSQTEWICLHMKWKKRGEEQRKWPREQHQLETSVMQWCAGRGGGKHVR